MLAPPKNNNIQTTYCLLIPLQELLLILADADGPDGSDASDDDN